MQAWDMTGVRGTYFFDFVECEFSRLTNIFNTTSEVNPSSQYRKKSQDDSLSSCIQPAF